MPRKSQKTPRVREIEMKFYTRLRDYFENSAREPHHGLDFVQIREAIEIIDKFYLNY